jgi:hypothetical protein
MRERDAWARAFGCTGRLGQDTAGTIERDLRGALVGAGAPPLGEGEDLLLHRGPLLGGEAEVSLHKVRALDNRAQGLDFICQGCTGKKCFGRKRGRARGAERLTGDLNLKLRGEGGQGSAEALLVCVLGREENVSECGP